MQHSETVACARLLHHLTAFPVFIAAAAPESCTHTLAVVSKQHTLQQQQHLAGTPTHADGLQEPLLAAAAAAADPQQQQGVGGAVAPNQQQLGAGTAAAAHGALQVQQQDQPEPCWCAVEHDGAAEAPKHNAVSPPSPAEAAAPAVLQDLPKHLTCKTISPMVSIEEGMIASAEDYNTAAPPAAAAAASPAAAWEPFGWQPPSASVAAAAAAAGELSAFHSSLLESHSFASPGVQSPFSGFSSYWHSGKHYSTLPLLSQHAQHTQQHTPTSVLSTPDGHSMASYQQQQQHQLVTDGRSLVGSCWAALRRMHCYVAAMGISFFVPCFIFPAMLSPEAASVSDIDNVSGCLQPVLVCSTPSSAAEGMAVGLFVY
jgi:hypothetical protein